MRATRPSDHAHDATDPGDLLRAHGLRRTPQRQAVLSAILERAGHATAEDVVARVRTRLPTVSASTVYRTLGTLEEVGILCHAHLGHGASVYHLGGGGLHQHLVCDRCGAMEEVEETLARSFADSIERRFGFRANLTHFAVLGECKRCRTTTGGRTSKGSRATRPRRGAAARGRARR